MGTDVGWRRTVIMSAWSCTYICAQLHTYMYTDSIPKMMDVYMTMVWGIHNTKKPQTVVQSQVLTMIMLISQHEDVCCNPALQNIFWCVGQKGFKHAFRLNCRYKDGPRVILVGICIILCTIATKLRRLNFLRGIPAQNAVCCVLHTWPCYSHTKLGTIYCCRINPTFKT